MLHKIKLISYISPVCLSLFMWMWSISRALMEDGDDWIEKQKIHKYYNWSVLPRLYLFYICSSRSVFIYDKNTFIFLFDYYIFIYKYKTIFTMSKGSWMDISWGKSKAYILSVCTWSDVRLVLCLPINS